MKNHIITLCIIALATMGSSSKVHDRRQVKMDMLRFINSKNYTYSKRKSDIPDAVIKLINEHGSGYSSVADGGDTGKTIASCIDAGDFAGVLNYVLVNDSVCLLGYTLGGFVLHTKIHYVRYSNKMEVADYDSWGMGVAEDTGALKALILKKNKPDKVWISPH